MDDRAEGEPDGYGECDCRWRETDVRLLGAMLDRLSGPPGGIPAAAGGPIPPSGSGRWPFDVDDGSADTGGVTLPYRYIMSGWW